MSVPYARLLAAIGEPFLRMAEKPAVTRLIPRGTEVTVDRADFPRESPRPGLAIMSLTSNIILLATLFAVNPKPLSDRNVIRFAIAALVLVVVHVLAVIVNVQSIYALRLGPWSTVHYGAFARNFWGVAAHFYSVVGVFGAPFALWWGLTPSKSPNGEGRSRRLKPAAHRP